MGFWKQLFGRERIPQGLPKPTRPAPQMPPIRNPGPILSEPVVSIIQSLKDGEWTFEEFVGGFAGRDVHFEHKEFDKKLLIYSGDHPRCLADWMTEEERYAVGEVCWNIFKEAEDRERKQYLTEQRESFMCFVKEKQ